MHPAVDIGKISYVADSDGRRTAAIVPIEVWREIEAEVETRYLLDNPVMRQRLLDAMHRQDGVPLDEALRRAGVSQQEVA